MPSHGSGRFFLFGVVHFATFSVNGWEKKPYRERESQDAMVLEARCQRNDSF